jgi:DNA-binding HxlR family transcriptional regulator
MATETPTQAAARAVKQTGRPCAIATTLALVGERWSLLAVRELFYGNRRFDQIARNTGAPRDILTTRLRRLEDVGVIERRQYNERPPRYEYTLTPAGRALEPVITALRQWGDRYAMEEPPVSVQHGCGHDLDAVWVCRHCNQEVALRDVSLTVNSAGWDHKGPIEMTA